MIRFRAFGVNFCLPWLTLIMPFLALRLGMDGRVSAVLLALCIHELAHILAAYIFGSRIIEIRLMPFGGSARMENPYRLPARKIIPVAAAGPFANLAAAVICAAMVHWGAIHPFSAAAFISPNLVLCAFNLLPALPLDGGRILFAALQPILGPQNALQTGLWLGRILALILLGAAFAGGLHSGRWNLTFMLAAIFIIVSARDERAALSKTSAACLSEQISDTIGAQPARIYQMDARCTAQDALALLRPQEKTWFILAENGLPCALMDGRSIVSAIINGKAPETALRDLPAGFSLPVVSGASKQPLSY